MLQILKSYVLLPPLGVKERALLMDFLMASLRPESNLADAPRGHRSKVTRRFPVPEHVEMTGRKFSFGPRMARLGLCKAKTFTGGA